MVERIRRPAEYEGLLNDLVAENSPFKTYKEVLVFAASLGYNRDRRRPFEKTGERINMQVFNGRFDELAINSIAVAAKEDAFMLSNENDDERILIFEEYACGGLEIMYNEMSNTNLSILDSITNLVINEKQESILDDLEDLLK